MVLLLIQAFKEGADVIQIKVFIKLECCFLILNFLFDRCFYFLILKFVVTLSRWKYIYSRFIRVTPFQDYKLRKLIEDYVVTQKQKSQ